MYKKILKLSLIALMAFFTLIGILYPIIRGDRESLLEILNLSVAFGGSVGLLMGGIAAISKKSLQLGLWILGGSILACTLTLNGLYGLALLASDIPSDRKPSGDSPPGAAAALGESLWIFILIYVLLPVAMTGGTIGAKLYEDFRDRHR